MDADSNATDEKQGDLRGVLPAGTRLQKYELISVLGHGSFGITYRARDAQLERDVAVKEYLPATLALREDGTTVVPRSTELAGDFVWGRERFLGEARTLARLSHAPAIVRVHDFLEANGTAYMVMGLAEGETLESRLKRDGALPAAVVEKILYPLLDGLEQVHMASFLHRDIKPANILLDAQDNPTLIDFGASRAAMAGRSTAMTAIFTPGYAAVEQMTSAKQGPSTDIYGLSATLYHAITGAPPPGAIDRVLNDSCTPLVQLAPAGFSPALLSAIDAGLGVRAEQRPQSIADWRQMLQQGAPVRSATVALPRRRSAQSAEPPSAPPPVAPVAAAPPMAAAPKRRTAVWVAAIAAAIMVLAGGGYLATTLVQEQAAQRAVAEAKAKAAEEALRKATAEAEAQRKADEAAARQRAAEAAQRQAAEEARRKAAAEAEAQRRADEAVARRRADEAAQRQLEEEARRKAAADAETQRRAADEAAARQKAELEAKQKADADRKKLETAGSAGAPAQTYKQLRDWCFDSASTNNTQKIQGCSAVTASGEETPSNKGIAFYNIGNAYMRMNQYDRSLPYFDQALKLKPDYSFAFNNRGNAYLHLNQYDRALQDYDQAVRFDPTNANAYANRALVYKNKGMLDRANADQAKADQLRKQQGR